VKRIILSDVYMNIDIIFIFAVFLSLS